MARNKTGDNSVLSSSIVPILAGTILVVVVFVLADRFLGFYNPNLLLMVILGLLIFVPLFNLIRSGWNPFQ